METSLNEPRESVHQVTSRLRTYEDFNLASKLQDEEFDYHYTQNRCERRRMSHDLRQSKQQQAIEDLLAAHHRNIQNTQIAERDEAIARRIQQEFERDETLKRESEARLDLVNCSAERDEAIARRIQQEFEREESLKRESQARLDAEFARRLQLDEESIQKRRVHKHSRPENEHGLRSHQQQHQKQQRQLINATPLTNTVRRIEQSAKKVLPMLASVTPKIQFGTPKSSSGRPRKNSGTIATADSQWCDKIDERTQNELNLQMATASGIVEEQNVIPSTMRFDNRDAPKISPRPLASVAARDTFASSSRQINSSHSSDHSIKSGSNPNSDHQSQNPSLISLRSSPLINDYQQQIVPGDAPLCNDSNTCPTTPSSESKQLVSSQNTNAFVTHVSKIRSPTTLSTNLTPSIPNRIGNVPLPPIPNHTQANFLEPNRSIQSFNESHHQSEPIRSPIHHPPPVPPRPLTNQASSTNSMPTLISNNYQANNTGYLSSNETSPNNIAHLQMHNIPFETNNQINQSAEGILHLHPTNPFLQDIQCSLSSDQSTHSVTSPLPLLSCTNPIQSSQLIASNRSNIQDSQLISPPSALTSGLNMDSTVRQQ